MHSCLEGGDEFDFVVFCDLTGEPVEPSCLDNKTPGLAGLWARLSRLNGTRRIVSLVSYGHSSDMSTRLIGVGLWKSE